MQKDSGYTALPNIFVKKWLPLLSPSACKTYLIIARETHGYHRKETNLSERDLQKRTGLTRNTVKRAIDELVSNGLIAIIDKGTFLDKKPTKYRILL